MLIDLQKDILKLLAEKGPMRVPAIRESVGANVASLRSVIDLHKSGLIGYADTNTDKYSTYFQITDEGLKALDSPISQ